MMTTPNSWILGVNLSGAEYGNAETGRMYWDYIYPTTAELDHFAADGATVVRIPISLERLQPTAGGALDSTQLATLDALVAHATANGLKIILDPHNYGYAFDTEIGINATSNMAFADFWSKLAGHYASNSQVIFGLMNEPHVQSAPEWLISANLAIAAIRQSGATTQEILVPGTAWDTGATWQQSGNAAAFAAGVVDPSNNYAIEVHQYFDSDNSGTHNTVVSATIGAERLAGVTQWAQATGHKLFLGEFGVASDTASLAALSNTLKYMQTHADVWQGGTYWASGPWMSNYMYALQTANGSDTAQMAALEKFMSLPAASETTIAAVTPVTPAATVIPAAETTPAPTLPGSTHVQTTNPSIVTAPVFIVPPMPDTPLVTMPTSEADPVWVQVSTTTAAPSPIAAPPTHDDAGITFRFFDAAYGTQFLTSSLSERASLIATRPDLVYEGKGMGTVQSDPNDSNVASVFRFFNKVDGTHFFTTSAMEKDQIIATRSDLAFEASSFNEHLIAQAGDMAVYRFFNSTNGSHFFTASDAERASISATRSDMVDEGVVFYAPKV